MVQQGPGGEVLYLRPKEAIGSIDDIIEANTDIKHGFVRLQSEGQEVIGGSWTGSAASKLDEGWQQWQDGIHKITASLDGISELAKVAITSLQQASERLT
ncbi:WXG100 family type VII secretion target [Mycobacteroides abscessus subsp. bolletii]|uniref:WXG100 family type VII secretion target n=1 Tax=Mycobacteroides abscessus TaxID=36809 RepID=UPI0009278950|nr:WXG100 family type VII secretion target [Mycobacteroides abscessus]SHQ33959.1 WXG100 family type VII secretion target [Mycobacteroides abscessus subsp. bolletii]SHS08866.1 WXG100 family type VII secretion target [Mycobacteroides abscessus subsp. bolletii]SHS82212.1 WXG100 family type VII secretion target [Mycobacteroides abscessus subsp. bolletii]SHS86037.1 WXG100 family type VII secretion target [Mycobacteroides abscessus subsp. bolletii]SHX72487.1 WXG100 family type VII secretion target [